MTTQVIIGNIISFIAACFLALSCWTKNEKRVFLYQIVENTLLALSSAVFGSWSAVWTTLLSNVRCVLVVKDRFTKPVMLVYTAAVLVIGVLTNTKGAIGLLPVLATAEMNYLSYRFADNIVGLKWMLLINLLLWDIYAFAILDFASGIAWAVTFVITAVSLWQLKHSKPAKP